MYPGDNDIALATAALAARIPGPLASLAKIAYNYAWSWLGEGESIFAAIDPDRWEFVGHNPVHLLSGAPLDVLLAATDNAALRTRIHRLESTLEADKARPFATNGALSPEHPVAYLSAEFGVHRSLPVY